MQTLNNSVLNCIIRFTYDYISHKVEVESL